MVLKRAAGCAALALLCLPFRPGLAASPEVARGLYDFLCARKILVRHFGSHALTSPFLRISVGTDEEMSLLQEHLEAWLKSA